MALALSLVSVLVAGAGMAGPCRAVSHDGEGYVVCTVTAGDDVRLWLDAPEGGVFGGFRRLSAALASEGEALAFAMNAGMYHADRSPVGLYVEHGTERRPVVTAAGPGNFGMLPNGVFCVLPDGFAVMESRAFAGQPQPCRHATQSGPMLVIDGALHPRFIPDSPSRFVRNGVGVSADGQTAHFAISDRPVSFDAFARLFRDALEVPQALYFDGNVSRLHAPDLGRSDLGRQLGPIVGMVVPADPRQR